MTPVLPTYATLRLVGPELWLALAMCAVLLTPLLGRKRSWPLISAFAGLLLALLAALATAGDAQAVFHRALVIDPFSQFFKVLLMIFSLLVLVQWVIAGREQMDDRDTPDFLCLILGATLGMSLMASASNLLSIFIAIESASLPSYALAGFRKRHRIGSEGSLKYVVFGAASSSIMLYGMSLIYGCTGSLDLGTIAQAAAKPGFTPLFAIGVAGFLAGIAFKLSAVPLHFWCPDVFQGAPMAVTTFLSVASKGAAVCLLARILSAFGQATNGTTAMLGLTLGVAALGALTATWGNLVAFHQNNIKRLLAYSSIAHAGYMIMAAALLPVAGAAPARVAAGALLFYLLVYLFMNLGAFTVAALIAQRQGVEDIRQYAGLSSRAPYLTAIMVLFLLSLFGMPGLGGFMGKIYLMQAMADLGAWGFVLIAILLFNTLISLYLYLRPAYYMIFVQSEEPEPQVAISGSAMGLLAVCVLALLWTGILPSMAAQRTRDSATLLPSRLIQTRIPESQRPQASLPEVPMASAGASLP